MDFEKLVNIQRVFFNTNVTKDIRYRIEQLEKLKSVIKDNEGLLYDSVYSDFKKSSTETYITELSPIYNDINEAIKKVRKWSKIRKVKTNLVNFPAKSYILPEPLGVCLVMGAWNYPYQLSFGPVIAAIAAGNTVILKPSEVSVKTSRAMANIINENFIPECFKVVEGGIDETTDLLKQKFDKIFFTGSGHVGKIIYKAAAENLTPVTLELGGKSPVFVTRNCDLSKTVKRLMWAKFLNSGQTCIAPDYVLVDSEIKDKFLALLKESILKYDYSFENGNYVQIINEKNFMRLVNVLDENKIFHGGKYDISQRYIEPTILSDICFEDKIMEEEIFGPILPVIFYDSIEAVISEVKKRPKPLSCYLFTRDSILKKRLLKELSFGGGAVNDALMHITNSNLPFGGVGESGTGNYHGEAGFRAFSHYKSILEKSFVFEPDLKYSPYSKKKLSLLRWFANR